MNPADRPLTHERLLEVLSYDPDTGVFRWNVRLSRRNRVDEQAGYIAGDGYRIIQIDGWHYKAGRLAWFYHYGRWPHPLVDHRDLNRDNSRLSNLREATYSQNAANAGVLRSNTSGFKGVSRVGPPNRAKPWRAQIRKDRKRIFLGYFATAEEAGAAYVAAADIAHGEFARSQGEGQSRPLAKRRIR